MTMNNAKVNTSTISKDNLYTAAKEAAKVYAVALNKQDEVTAKEFYNAKEAMDKSIVAYNDATLKEAYDELLSADNPIVALCRRFAWSKIVARSVTNNTSKTISISLNGRRTRFNILDFLDYAEKEDYVFPNAAAIKNTMTLSARTLTNYIRGCITNEKTTPIGTAKSALQQLIDAIGMEDVHANSVDVRFITFAVTKARDLGELAAITDSAVAPYIMDVFHVQINRLAYKFEQKKDEKAETKVENPLPSLEEVRDAEIAEIPEV